MPADLSTILAADPAEQSAFISAEVTDIEPLDAAHPVFGDLRPDDYKAYVNIRICTAFPNVIGPEMHGRYFGFHPQVLLNSWRSLIHQQTNLGHSLKAYSAYRDRIQGGVVAVAVAQKGKPYRPMGKVEIPETVEDAPYLDVVAVLWKLAEGTKELLGGHLSSRKRQSVSIEVGTTVSDLSVYDPRERAVIPMQSAAEMYPELLKRDKTKGIQIGKVDGVQFAFAAGHADGSVPFRGYGYTPNPAEARTARIVDIAAASGEAIPFAARAVYDWEPGMEVRWSPILLGSDAGRGTVTEVIYEGKKSLHGMNKQANASDPLLVIKVHGKRLEVIRHASSVKAVAAVCDRR